MIVNAAGRKFALWSGLIVTVFGVGCPSRAWAVVSVWTNIAGGQTFDCNGPDPGGIYVWPNNDDWSQELRIADDPCGNPGVIREPSNWTTALYPDNGRGGVNYDVVLGAPEPTLLNISPTIDRLTVLDVGVLDFLNTRSLTIAAGAVTNDGQISINGAFNPNSTPTVLTIGADTLLSGSGRITMSNSGLNRIWGGPVMATTHRLTQAAGHTIQGSGNIGANTIDLTNHGLIESHHDGGTLRIDPANDVDNEGLLRARDGGMLLLRPGVFENVGGVIRAESGSEVRLEGAIIVGGTLSTSGGSGQFTISSTEPTLQGVTSLATINQPSGRTTLVTGGMINRASWNVNGSSPNTTSITFAGDMTLDGGGEIVLSNATDNRLLTDGSTLTQAASHTIRGAGLLLNATGSMVNRGTIVADQAIALTVRPSGTGSFTNEGTMRATGPGGLRLFDGTFVNATTIEAQQGSQVILDGLGGTRIIGGTLASMGTGRIVIRDNPTLTNVTTIGSVVQANGDTVTIAAGLTNNATWNLNSTLNATDIIAGEDLTLGGNGTVVLAHSLGSRIRANAPGIVITNGPDHTIRGTGKILANAGGFVNRGTIVADQPLGIAIDPTAPGFVNEGSVRIEAGSDLVMAAGTDDRYRQTAGSTIVNGALVAAPSGVHLQGGSLGGNGTVGGNVFNTGGTVGPGESAGKLTLAGLYNQNTAAAVGIELAGPTQGTQYDWLAVTGAATLAGTLNFTTVAGFAPSVGDTFEIMTFASRTGQFNTVNHPPGCDWDVIYNPTNVTLRLTRTGLVSGDLNQDCIVDRYDARILAEHFGTITGALTSQGDLDGDGAIDLADASLLQSQLTVSPILSPAATAVPIPEPSAIVFLLFVLAGIRPRTRRYRR